MGSFELEKQGLVDTSSVWCVNKKIHSMIVFGFYIWCGLKLKG